MTYLHRVAASTKPSQGDVYKGTHMCEYINTFESSTYASLNNMNYRGYRYNIS